MFLPMKNMSLSMILRKFLFLKDFEPRDSYKNNSYKKNGVLITFWVDTLDESCAFG